MIHSAMQSFILGVIVSLRVSLGGYWITLLVNSHKIRHSQMLLSSQGLNVLVLALVLDGHWLKLRQRVDFFAYTGVSYRANFGVLSCF